MGYGKQLEAVLKKKSLSVADLARASGIPAQTLYSIIKRDPSSVGLDKVMAIEHALGIRPGDDLFNTLHEIPADPENTRIIQELEHVARYGIFHGPQDRLDRLLDHFHQLNPQGQEKAVEQVELVAKVPEYRADQDHEDKEKRPHT